MFTRSEAETIAHYATLAGYPLTAEDVLSAESSALGSVDFTSGIVRISPDLDNGERKAVEEHEAMRASALSALPPKP